MSAHDQQMRYLQVPLVLFGTVLGSGLAQGADSLRLPGLMSSAIGPRHTIDRDTLGSLEIRNSTLHSLFAMGTQGRRLAARVSPVVFFPSLTPVRDQGDRGTCSIFSSVAALEYLLRKKMDLPASLNLSEEWLNYVNNHERKQDGSVADANVTAWKTWGVSPEAAWRYDPRDWQAAENASVATAMCGHVPSHRRQRCLLAHRDTALLMLPNDELKTKDPAFFRARAAAQSLKERADLGAARGHWARSTSEVKQAIAAGLAVLAEVDFYYEAWNHGGGDGLGLHLDHEAWKNGRVGNVWADGRDFRVSKRRPTGHSILLVGYDDEVRFQQNVTLQDGSRVQREVKGIYYFKNSWGIRDFGSRARLPLDESEERTVPGFGVISQDHLENLGEFFILSLP